MARIASLALAKASCSVSPSVTIGQCRDQCGIAAAFLRFQDDGKAAGLAQCALAAIANHPGGGWLGECAQRRLK